MLSIGAFGQTPDTFFSAPVIDFNPKFFFAVLAGLLIALGFQLVLTNLSVAVGVTAIGNLKNKMLGSRKAGALKRHEEVHEKENEKSDIPMGVKFMSAAGAWGMITAVLSLFFATLFAVKLSLIPDNSIGVTLGLTIWAVFFMVMLYLESRAIGSILSGLFNSAVGAVRAGLSGIGSVFEKSETAKLESVVEHSIDKVKNDVYHMMSEPDLRDKVESYLNKLQPKEFDTDKLKDELAELINEIKVEEKEGEVPGEKEFFLRVAEKQPRFSKQDVRKLSKLYDMARKALQMASATGGIGSAAALFTRAPAAQRLKQEVEEYLARTGEPELNPDLLKAELEEIFRNPSAATEIIKNKARAFDKETIISVVAAKEGVSEDKARKVADKVEEAINTVRGRVQSNKDLVENKLREAKDKVGAKKDELLNRAELRIKEFLDKVDRPELDYHVLRTEFEAILHNPKLAPDVLKMKIKQMDAESLKAIIAATDRYSREDAERMVHKFEEARANVLGKIDRAEEEIKHRVEEAKRFSAEQAENTRKTAVAASWWLLGTFVVSAIAAAAGGALAL